MKPRKLDEMLHFVQHDMDSQSYSLSTSMRCYILTPDS